MTRDGYILSATCRHRCIMPSALAVMFFGQECQRHSLSRASGSAVPNRTALAVAERCLSSRRGRYSWSDTRPGPLRGWKLNEEREDKTVVSLNGLPLTADNAISVAVTLHDGRHLRALLG